MALLPLDRTCHKLSYRVIVRSFSYSVLSIHLNKNSWYLYYNGKICYTFAY